jgi:hypothetical protein
LAEIKEQKLKHDEESEEYLNLEDERRILRKELIDCDYEHRILFERYKKQNQEVERKRLEESERKIMEEQESLEKIREEERLDRSRKLEEQIGEINKDAERRREELRRLAEPKGKE